MVASTFDQSDWLKLLGIAGAMLVLYILARRLGGGDESYPPPMDTSSSAQIRQAVLRDIRRLEQDDDIPPDADNAEATEQQD